MSPSDDSPAPRPATPILPGAWWLAVPLALAVAAYWRVLPGQFQFDDDAIVVLNAGIKELGTFLGAAPWLAALTGGRPVVELTFALNYAYGGLQPWNFHLTNLLVHLAATVLAWAVVRRVLRLAGAARADGQAVVVAGLFALHPLQSEAVSYVWQRSESLAGLLYLAGLGGLLRSDQASVARGRRWLLLGGGLAFLLGLGTKPTVVTLPAAWLLLAALVPSPAARGGQVAWRQRLGPALLMLAVVAAYGLRLVGGLQGTDVGAGVGITPWTFLLTQLRVLPTYLRLLAWPAGQSVDWHLAPGPLLTWPATAASGLLVVTLAGGALWLAVRARLRDDADGAAARLAGAGLLWFFLLLAPTSSVVPIVDLLVEHRLYLPSLGVFLAASVAAERALARWAPPRLAPALAAVAWLALAVALHARNAVWETRRALWSDAAAKAPANPRAWANLALAISEEGRAEEALGLWRRALALAGDGEPALRCRILDNLGLELLALGQLEEAERTLREAVAITPHTGALNGLASVLMARSKLAEAEVLLTAVLARDPGHGEALTSLGQLHLVRGDPAGALPLLDRAVAADPDQPQRRSLRARALAGLGRRAEGCAVLAALPATLERSVATGVAAAWRDLGCGGR